MSKFVGAKNTQMCGPAKVRCYKNANSFEFKLHRLSECNCLPSCTVLSYNAYSTEADYDYMHAYLPIDFQEDHNFKKYFTHFD